MGDKSIKRLSNLTLPNNYYLISLPLKYLAIGSNYVPSRISYNGLFLGILSPLSLYGIKTSSRLPTSFLISSDNFRNSLANLYLFKLSDNINYAKSSIFCSIYDSLRRSTKPV